VQEQAPQWLCPVCNKTVSFDLLQIDHYVEDILRRTSRSVEQVTVEPNGQWSEVKEGQDGLGQPMTPDEDDGEDLVELTNDYALRPVARLQDSLPAPFNMRTPVQSSREQSTNSTAVSSTGKRTSAVIDLTLDSDEDDPVRGPRLKRQATYQTRLDSPLPHPISGISSDRGRLSFSLPQASTSRTFGSSSGT